MRVRVDGVQYDLAEAPTLDKYKRHTIEVVVDRYVVRRAEAPDGWGRDGHGRPIDPGTGTPLPDPDAARLADSIETALRLGEGVVDRRRAERAAATVGPAIEVTSVAVLEAEEEPAATLERDPEGVVAGTASDWLPGIRDEHDEERAGRPAGLTGRPGTAP